MVKYILAGIISIAIGRETNAQSAFSQEGYLNFLETHQNYTSSKLIEDHPPKTTYYSSRQYPVELSSIPWYDSLNSQFSFTSQEKRMLQQNLFVVSERLESPGWASAFINLYSSDLPLFLSTDFILSTLHNSYDAILQTIEWQFLEANLKELLHAMYEYFPTVATGYSGDNRFDAIIKDVELYLSVALSLAENMEYLPRYGSPAKYLEVMSAIDAEQMISMTLFTETRSRKIDFSQFTPRGHYNKEIYTRDGVITLESYFKAMMWLGRIDFLLTAPPDNPWEPDWTGEELRRMQLGALLLNEVLYGCGKLENLTRHEEIISFMVGPDDNLNPAELMSLKAQMLTSPQSLFNEEVFGDFMEALNGSDDYGQKIMSNFFYVDPYSSDPGNLPVSFKLLGQKFLVDSYVFSELVFDRIIFNGEKIWRPMPDPLDAMAALGSEDALALLEGEMDQYKYAGNMAGLKYLIDAYDDSFWNQSLYNTWLSAIRSLNPVSSSSGLPYFMQTTAWHHEKLNTQLTSWAQLRHDNILYGKQSYTGGTSCSYPFTYVEPYPELYRILKLFAENASVFFNSVLTGKMVESKERILDYYDGYAQIMGNLEEIATKELERTRLSEGEVTFLKTMINSVMASGPSITGWYNDLFYDVQKGLTWDFTVADVHTQPTDYAGSVVGHVLHVGNGKINMGVFLAENPCNPGQYMAFAGPVSSFYQEVTSNFDRLNDQEWQEYFLQLNDLHPERPDWVASYLVDRGGMAYPGGRELKGALFTGTGTIPGTEPRLLDYILLFPNPVSEEAHLRFLLNIRSEFGLEVYDASGRLVHIWNRQLLEPAEHDISLAVHDWPQGIYLLKIGIGNTHVVKEMMVQ